LLNDPIIGAPSRVRVTEIRGPKYKDKIFVHRVFCDGKEVSLKKESGRLVGTSLILSEGVHQWSAQTYLADSREESAFAVAIAQYEKERDSLRSLYKSESDPLQKQQILNKIQLAMRNILSVEKMRDKSRRALGEPAELRFSVI
jgi:hypothetical protein